MSYSATTPYGEQQLSFKLKLNQSTFYFSIFFLPKISMPAVSVFEFAQKVKQYVAVDLDHSDWFITNLRVVYSTRVKPNKFGYMVVPLCVCVLGRDADKRIVKCRIEFDELCKIVGGYAGGSHLPYLKVSTSADDRDIFDTGVTSLDIACTKTGNYNGYPTIKHKTIRMDSTDKMNALNAKVINKIQKRLEENNTDHMRKMELQFRELLEIDDDEVGDESQPEDYDYSDNVSVSCDVGGYKD